MTKIGITGSLASGKTTASTIISKNRGPLFSADKAVKLLYKRRDFKKLISKKLKVYSDKKLKAEIKKKIINNKKNIRILERIIHPLVRQQMFTFSKRYKNKRLLFFEIPLLVESKLMKYFDVIIFIKSKYSLRMNRYLLNGGNKKLFLKLDKSQLEDRKKLKFCDHIVVNNTSKSVLRRKLLAIIKKYE